MPQPDGLYRLHIAVDDDSERISLLYRIVDDEVRIVWVLAGP
ncbi:hypothetical protein [Streptomyces sp. WMMC1477]|nr:hypothetical protein [Streptomyces sp. WMMC1477]MCZ7430151.1 hypothetical protein [Streptomyces sp. WMMC1477]